MYLVKSDYEQTHGCMLLRVDLASENYGPSPLDFCRARAIAKRDHCIVKICCKCGTFEVDEDMTYKVYKRLHGYYWGNWDYQERRYE